jgi:multiple sugar transport system substrate-binding protein
VLALSAGAAGATALAAACGPIGPREAQQRERPELAPAKLRWYEWDAPPFAETIVEAYQQRQPQIAVSVEHATGDYYEKLETLFVGGDAPDLINTQSWRWITYAAKALLAPLDALRARDRFDLAWPKPWEKLYDPQTRFRGKLYARPFHMGGVSVVYSKELFDRLGVPYPSPEWTYPEFLDLARRLTQAAGGEPSYGFQSPRIYTRWFGWWRMEGQTEWDRLVEPTKAQWTLPTVMERLEFLMYGAFHSLRISPAPTDQARGVTIDQGKAAMKVEGPWFLPSMWGEKASRAPGVPFDVVPMPKGKDGRRVTAGVGHTHTISAQTKQPEATWDLMKFIATDPAQEIVARITGRQPITPEQNQKIWAPLVQGLYNFKTADAFIKSLEFGQVHLAGELNEGALFRDSGFNDALDAMIAGQQRASEVIPEANRRMQQILDDYWARQKK